MIEYIFKLIITFTLIVISCNSFAQKIKKEKREIQEIKLIFKDFTNNNNILQINKELDGTLILPTHFKNYKNYFKEFDKNGGALLNFTPSKIHKLIKSDCVYLNYVTLNDSNLLFIEKSWFPNNKVKTLTDSARKLYKHYSQDFMKPIFFRNYKRCFIAFYYSDNLYSYFLKKKNKHWVYDRVYKIVAVD